MSAASASAECAWVLWEKYSVPGTIISSWQPRQGFGSADACRRFLIRSRSAFRSRAIDWHAA
jgi:hypothetical protein